MRSIPAISVLASLVFWAAGAAAQDPGPVPGHAEAFGALPRPLEILYLPGKYAACLRCHPKELVEEEDFNVPTNFRDTVLGKNLHGLHVYRQPKGSNCTACHRLDPASGAVVLRPDAAVTLEDDGGRCAPACHRPKAYRNAGRPPGRELSAPASRR